MSEMIKKSDLLKAVCDHCDLHGECEAGHCELTDVINGLKTEDIVRCWECKYTEGSGPNDAFCGIEDEWVDNSHYCAYGKKREGAER